MATDISQNVKSLEPDDADQGPTSRDDKLEDEIAESDADKDTNKTADAIRHKKCVAKCVAYVVMLVMAAAICGIIWFQAAKYTA
jgi:hypothetical protein